MQLVLHSSTLPASRSTSTPSRPLLSASRRWPASRRCRWAARRSTRCASTSIPRNLSAHGIGIDEAASAIQTANVNLPTGTIYGADHTYTILANGQLLRASEYASTIVAYRNGNPVRLDAIAHVYDGIENDKSPFWFNGAARHLAVGAETAGHQRRRGRRRGQGAAAEFREQLPPSITLDIRSDRSIAIRESVADIKFTLLLTICLAVMVIFVFLRNVSATVIPSLALPVSLVATFAVMYLLGYSLDNLSLLALILSVAFIVDNTIVMLENIIRHMEMGKAPMRAALEGSKEIAFTIVSMTLALVAVFIPVLFMGGIVGRLLNEFAVTIAVAILVSGFVSISLTPMLCSRFLTPPAEQRHGWFYNITERMFDAWRRLYDVTLRQSLRFHAVTMAISVVAHRRTAYLFTLIPKGFLPNEDVGRDQRDHRGDPGHRLRRHGAQGAADRRDHRPQPEHQRDCRTSSSATAATSTSISSRATSGRRPATADHRRAAPAVAQVPGMRVFINMPQPINLGGQQGARSPYQFTLQDTDTTELYRWAPILEGKIRAIAGLEDVSSDLQVKNPQIRVDMNRDRISALGLTVNQVETALNNAYGTRQVSQIYAPNNQYQVVMQVAPEFQKDPAALSMLYVRSSGGRLIPLNTLASVTTDVGPLTVAHTGQLPSVTIAFNLKQGVALGDAVSRIQATAASTLPSTVTTSFQGAAQAFQDSLRGLGLILLMAIVVIYIVLGVLYESFTHPLTILSGLAVSRFRRAAHASRLQGRAQPVRVRRHHHAHRPGEEERHHDGGFRGGRAARARPLAARCHPRSVSRAIPADHDDDDGGAGWHAADCARPWRGRRVSSSTRPRGRRRACSCRSC